MCPVGIGIFGHAGWSPKDRNAIDQFYSFGIGVYGMLIPERELWDAISELTYRYF